MFGAMHLQAMARNNAWSNHRMLEACRELTQDEFEAKRVSFFLSLQLTLNHICESTGTTLMGWIRAPAVFLSRAKFHSRGFRIRQWRKGPQMPAWSATATV